jgi:DNA-binding NtrC family response regulator
VLIPPLRERTEDIALLLAFFLKTAYDFPGNIRELKAMIFDAVARYSSGVLSMERFKEVIGSRPAPAIDEDRLSQRMHEWLLESHGRFPKIREVEDFLIGEAMKRANSNQGIAASLLGLTRQTLNSKLKIRRGKKNS